MGNKVLSASSIIVLTLWAFSAQAGAPFVGCVEWCKMMYGNDPNWRRLDDCYVQTQNEGRCGGGKKPGSSDTTGSTRTQNPTQQQQVQQQQQQQQQQAQSPQVTNNVQAIQCQSQYLSLYSQCSTAVEDTAYSCDEKNDSGMNSVASSASQMALMMGQQTAASVQSACSKMADLSQAANAALAAYRLTCSNSLNSCRSSCSQLVDFAKSNSSCFSGGLVINVQGGSESMNQLAGQLNGNASGFMPVTSAESLAGRCNNYESKVNEAQQAIQNYGLTSANASQCAQLSKGTASAVPEFCKANPTYPGCNPAAPVDCSNPQVAGTNKVCICSRNPHDSVCSQSQKAGGGSLLSGNIDSSSRLAEKNQADWSGDIPDIPSIQHGSLPTGGPGEAVDGRQGSAQLEGNTGAGTGVGSDGKSRLEASKQDSPESRGGGFYGGGGHYQGNAGGGTSANSYRGTTEKNPGAGGAASGPDLRQFLPGGKFDPRIRGLAGASGPDGITGPHSNIWQKIQNRYQVVSPSLIP